jgi:hypothetical protein
MAAAAITLIICIVIVRSSRIMRKLLFTLVKMVGDHFIMRNEERVLFLLAVSAWIVTVILFGIVSAGSTYLIYQALRIGPDLLF